MKSREISDKKRFYLYVLYVYGWSSIMTLIAFILDSKENIPNDFRPGFGEDFCYLKSMQFINMKICLHFSGTLFLFNDVIIFNNR